jgi:putative redox protein
MAAMKKVQVTAKMGPKYTIESKIRNHTIFVDQPPASGGDDKGPTPLEYQMVALGGCIGSIGRIIAGQKKMPLRGMEIAVEGDLNVDFLLGRTKEGRAGFPSFKVSVKIDADMNLEEKKAFLHEIDVRCPISENLAHGAQVTVNVVE